MMNKQKTTAPTMPSTNPYTPASDRYDVSTNWFRRCGRSGLMLPALSLGCWHNFGAAGTDAMGHADEASIHDNCRQMLFTAFDHGITHFDFANNYGPPPGAAESRAGRILREDFRGHRDELIISTKAGYDMWQGPYGNFGSRKYLLASLDQSLSRLDLDYVDIFYHHRPDPDTPLEETLGALDQAVRSGKALYAGVSNYNGELATKATQLVKQHGMARPIINQPRYSMFDRKIETDLLPATEQLGMGMIIFSPLAQGMLTDKYLSNIPKDSRAAIEGSRLQHDQIKPEIQYKIQQLNELAKQRGQSLAQMALTWALRNSAVTSAIIGASRPSQIKQNLEIMAQAPLSQDELRQIDLILA